LAGRTRTEHDFRNIVEDIFSQQDRQKSLDKIEHYAKVLDLIIGTRGFTGKRLVSARPMFESLFEVEETVDPDDLDTDQLDALEESL